MELKVVIIDYGLGNIRSAKKSVVAAMHLNNLKGSVSLSSNFEAIKGASHIILPGQGAFGSCINGLESLDGMIEELNNQVIIKKKPIFGICVGMQLFANKSLEKGTHKGLGWIEGEILKLPSKNLILPHMGWNGIEIEKNHFVFDGLSLKNFYFVHSYYFNIVNKQNILASASYGIKFPALISKDNIYGAQFHPEKSSDSGIKLLNNFLKIG